MLSPQPPDKRSALPLFSYLSGEPSLNSNAYLCNKTVAAISTGQGGAISLVRISGDHAFAALDKLTSLSNKTPVRVREPRKLYSIDIKDSEGKLLDKGLFVKFVAPNSFTGENLVELHLHGNSYISYKVMTELEKLGVRQALPGEFSFRAVKNGKLSLPQAEAVRDLFDAKNDAALEMSLEKLGGTQHRLIAELGDGLRYLAAQSELGIDFSDQEVPELSVKSLKEKLIGSLELLNRLNSSFDRGLRVQEGIHLVILGFPNAGKSSFFNELCGSERSIVSTVPGTTRDVVGETLTLKGSTSNLSFRVQDTAGIDLNRDRVRDPIELEGIKRTQKASSEADMRLFVCESIVSNKDFQENSEIWKSAYKVGRSLGIITKSDLVNAEKMSDLVRKLHSVAGLEKMEWIVTSAKLQKGVAETAKALVDLAQKSTFFRSGEVLLCRKEQKVSVENAINHIERALKVEELDLFAADIRLALNELSPLIGQTPADDVLGKIFSDFCIGK